METHTFLIGSEWRTSGAQAAVTDPFTGKVIAQVYLATAEDVNAAVIAAQNALPVIAKLPAYTRSEILLRVAERIGSERDAIAKEITEQVGKPIRYSLGEVDRAVTTFTLAAEEAKRINGEALPLDTARGGENAIGITQRFPIGVIAAISPFNFPLNLVAHKVAPAFASGNAVILKPPPQAPLTSLRLGRIFLECGAPAGALNVLPCPNDVAERLVIDGRIAMLSFTGSANVGWHLRAKAGKKRTILELGGNAAVIVEDTPAIVQAAAKIAASAFAYAGQVCISAQRIFINKNIFDAFTETFIEETARLKVGDPMDTETVVGPMIDSAALNRINQWIQDAVAKGANILCGGKQTENIFPPTVLTNVPKDTLLCSEEAFAPVAMLEAYNAFEEAITQVNASRYGLQASVFTNDMVKAFHAFRSIRAGAVIINNAPSFRIDSMPYGGVKDSGAGREGLRYAIQEMTEERLMVI